MKISYQLTREHQENFLLQTLETPASANWMKAMKIAMIIAPELVLATGFMGAIRYHLQTVQNSLDVRPFLTVTIAAASLFLLFFNGVYGFPEFGKWYVKRLVRKAYLEMDDGEALMEKPADITLDISDQSIQQRARDTVVEHSEPFIKRLVETNDYITSIPEGGEKGLIIPKRAFQSKDELAQFKQLLTGFILKQN